jgi:hypothetical protein
MTSFKTIAGKVLFPAKPTSQTIICVGSSKLEVSLEVKKDSLSMLDADISPPEKRITAI